MTRTGRAVPRLLAVLLAVLCAAACTSSSGTTTELSGSASQAVLPPTDPDHPNIVFVVADDLTPDLLAYLPHVRAMQRHGLTMDNFFSTDPVGTPARAALMTGRYAHTSGVYTSSGKDGGLAAFDAKDGPKDTFALGAHRAGYTTGLLGAYLDGYRPTQAPPVGWDRWAVTDAGYGGFDYTLRQNDGTHKYGSTSADYITDVMGDRATYFIKSASAAGTPFFLQLSTFAPHQPAVAATRYANALPTTTYPRGPTFDQAPAHPPSWLKFGPLSAPALAAIDAQYRARVRSVLAVDDLVARVEKALTEAGVASNTYLVFTSTNGYHLGEYRLPPGKQTAFDTDIHVPLVVTGPGVRVNKHATQFGSSIDLAPTFARLIGATLPATPDGVSLDTVWHGARGDVGAQAVLIEHHRSSGGTGDPDAGEAAGDPPDYTAIRTAQALYVRYASGEQEYYDLAADPDELHNLAGGRPVPSALQRALAALTRCHGARQCQAAALVATG